VLYWALPSLKLAMITVVRLCPLMNALASLQASYGRASVVLAETLGSFAAYMCLDPEKHHAVGLEVNANHLDRLNIHILNRKRGRSFHQ
jgi:hypothetical protein